MNLFAKSPLETFETQNTIQKIPIALIGIDHPTVRNVIHLLLHHPQLELTSIYDFQKHSQKIGDIFPELNSHSHLKIEPLHTKDIIQNHKAVILASDHPTTENLVTNLRKRGIKIVKFYFSKNLSQKKEIYGLCEIFREDIKQSHLIGLPHPVAIPIVLCLAPFLQNQAISPETITCDVKTSPRLFAPKMHFLNLQDNLFIDPNLTSQYKQEIHKQLNFLSKEAVKLHIHHTLMPIQNGIHVTIYAKPFQKSHRKNFTNLFHKFYTHYPFVNLLKEDQVPQIQNVLNSNQCQIGLHYDNETENLVLNAVIDENIKGSAGSAIQCLNLMYNLPISAGLPLAV